MESRDIKGRFADGGPGGPGRPRAATEKQYLRATMAACSIEDWRAIARKAVEDSLAGDAKAREFLAKYLLGHPDTAAPSPFQVVVDDQAGADDVAEEVANKRFLESLNPIKLR